MWHFIYHSLCGEWGTWRLVAHVMRSRSLEFFGSNAALLRALAVNSVQFWETFISAWNEDLYIRFMHQTSTSKLSVSQVSGWGRAWEPSPLITKKVEYGSFSHKEGAFCVNLLKREQTWDDARPHGMNPNNSFTLMNTEFNSIVNIVSIVWLYDLHV